MDMTYLSIEWPKAEALAKQEDFDGALIDAQDEEAEWLDRVPFGEQVDSDYFESPYLLMDFNDWFRDEKGTMDPRPRALQFGGRQSALT